MADNTNLQEANEPTLRLLTAVRGWWLARESFTKHLFKGDLLGMLGSLVEGITWAVEIDTLWPRVVPDAYPQARMASPAGPVLDAYRDLCRQGCLYSAVHVAEPSDPEETWDVFRWTAAENLPLDPLTAEAYTKALAGEQVVPTMKTVIDFFLGTEELQTGQVWQILSGWINPPDIRQHAEMMATEDPSIVEAMQAAEGWRHLTVVHGPQTEDPASHGLTSFRVLLAMLLSPPPPHQVGFGEDRHVIAIGGPDAEMLTTKLEVFVRQFQPDDGSWEIHRGFVPGPNPPKMYQEYRPEEPDGPPQT